MEIGSLADWAMVLAAVGSFVLLYLTLQAQLWTLKEQQEITKIELERRSTELVPRYDVIVTNWLDPSNSYAWIYISVKASESGAKDFLAELRFTSTVAEILLKGDLSREMVYGNEEIEFQYMTERTLTALDASFGKHWSYTFNLTITSTSHDRFGSRYEQTFLVRSDGGNVDSIVDARKPVRIHPK